MSKKEKSYAEQVCEADIETTPLEDTTTTYVEGKKDLSCLERALILLKATEMILVKIEINYHIGNNSNPLDEAIVCDGEEMDGHCLLEDIGELVEELER